MSLNARRRVAGAIARAARGAVVWSREPSRRSFLSQADVQFACGLALGGAGKVCQSVLRNPSKEMVMRCTAKAVRMCGPLIALFGAVTACSAPAREFGNGGANSDGGSAGRAPGGSSSGSAQMSGGSGSNTSLGGAGNAASYGGTIGSAGALQGGMTNSGGSMAT